MSESRTALAAPGAEAAAVARVPAAVLSPGGTLQSIGTRPTWLAPLLLWTVASLAVAAVLAPRMDFERMTRERLERSGQNGFRGPDPGVLALGKGGLCGPLLSSARTRELNPGPFPSYKSYQR